MQTESIRYVDAVLTSQRAWQDARAKGFQSLTRLHQTVEFPLNWTKRFQEMILSGLPVPDHVRSQITNDHPPVRLGIALGTDDREAKGLFTRPHNINIVSHRPIRDPAGFNRGIMWANEIMTGEATHDTFGALADKGRRYPVRTRILASLLEKQFAITDPLRTPPKKLQPFINLLRDPDIRPLLMTAWFSGDEKMADRIIKRHADMSLNDMTSLMGRNQAYRRKKGEKTEGAAYMIGTGVAYADTRIPWVLTGFLGLNAVMAHVASPDIFGSALQTVAAALTGYAFGIIGPFVPSALAHETIHYFGEGEGHLGWYAMELAEKKQRRRKQH